MVDIRKWIDNQHEAFIHYTEDVYGNLYISSETEDEDYLREFVTSCLIEWDEVEERIQELISFLKKTVSGDCYYNVSDDYVEIMYTLYEDDNYLIPVSKQVCGQLVSLENDLNYLNAITVIMDDREYPFQFNEYFIVNDDYTQDNNPCNPEVLDAVKKVALETTYHSDGWRGCYSTPDKIVIGDKIFYKFDEGFSSVDGIHSTKFIRKPENVNRYDDIIILSTTTSNVLAVALDFYTLEHLLPEDDDEV